MLLAVRTLQNMHISPSGRRWLKTLQINTEYAGHLASQLVSFAKGFEVYGSSVQMAQLIEETVEVIRSAFPASITIRTVIPPDLWTVSGNPTSLHQMLMNLCINAGEAMPKGGKLRIEAANIDGRSDCTQLPGGAKPGKYVRIEVADSGCGIPDNIKDKIFDPFFTTKRKKGSGLGLFTVARVVESQNGHIEISSKLKQGTQFRVFLPAEMPLKDPSITQP
jgi:signal transduction histidine kinase